MLDKKQIWVIFRFQFKMGHKAAETARNINNTFGLVTANKGNGNPLQYSCLENALDGRAW